MTPSLKNKLNNHPKLRSIVFDGDFITFQKNFPYKKYSETDILNLFNKLRKDHKLSPVEILNDDHLDDISERILTYMDGSVGVSVKDECRLGGGKICNQGDINALNFSKI